MKDVSSIDIENAYYDRLHAEKYRDKGQIRSEHSMQMARNYSGDDIELTQRLFDIFRWNRFLPAGRMQAALGATEREVSPFNCSVSVKVDDNIPDIYKALTQAAMILRLGTGIGYNFSHLRPKNALVKKLQARASGPISFMNLFDASAALIESAGHRRGAQMGIINVDHPDIEAFIDAKMEKGKLTFFNISVGITDAFMETVRADGLWELKFEGKVYKTVSARALWDKILRNAYNSAEPGVIFLDRMNKMNNLWYCEEIEATNPCSEQPLPAHGLCTLGSFNLVAYLQQTYPDGDWAFNYNMFRDDIRDIVTAYDNVFENAKYAIPEHKEEALKKRRIGLGLTGIANAIEFLIGEPSYGDGDFCSILESIASFFSTTAYQCSVMLAKERGPFPLFDAEKYTNSEFIKTLPKPLQEDIKKYGIRNSHLISYAPCGTISQIAGNISSGVEPVFYHEVSRKVRMQDGLEEIKISDYMYREYGFKGRTLEECTVAQHLNVGAICQKYCDSAVSKTVNTPKDITYEEYRDIFDKAYDMGMKGCTVYRPAQEVVELRGSVIEKAEEQPANSSELFTQTCASGVCER